MNGIGVKGTEGVASEEIERGVDDGEAECRDCFRGANDRAGVIEGEIPGERQVLIERDGGAMVDVEIGGRDGLAGRRQGRGNAIDVDAAGEVEILGKGQGSIGGEADGDCCPGAVSRSRADVEIERPAPPSALVDWPLRARAAGRFSVAGAWTGVPIGG